ncbi:unnamed protein product [Miscanthus lutarioriparius]|uniref:Uncharacterized protein n=1 Tax=Miscanthus lutarioriparius TaxID=422564 RepID=A0A811REJ9_9POAL|nr:unnamed protein product [Miscanthus lutarioriparius]
MDPNVQRVLDELSGLNRRFDEQAEQAAGLNRQFDDLERNLSARNVVVGTRITDLSRRICDLEAAPADPQVQAVEGRLATLEASFTDFDARIVDLECLRTASIKDERDAPWRGSGVVTTWSPTRPMKTLPVAVADKRLSRKTIKELHVVIKLLLMPDLND